MRRKLKYRLPASRHRAGTAAWWLLALALAVVFAVVWWDQRLTGRKSKSKTQSTAQAAKTPAPPAPTQPATAPTHVPALAPAPAPVAPPIPPPTPRPAIPETPGAWPRPVENVFEAQVALVQQGISPGSLDGAVGSQTRAALSAFQEKIHLPVTGRLDTNTRARLLLTNSPYTTYTVTTNDLARLQPLSATWLGKSQQTALEFETILELVAEKAFSHPNLIRKLNPSINWSNVPPGTVLQVPDVSYPPPHGPAAFIVISLAARTLEAFDDNTNLLVHFPVSIGKIAEKRPVGELHVLKIAPHPDYTFDPANFPESEEARQLKTKLKLPPGPNNPVGMAWISLDRPSYGIHGTPGPEQVGRTESHGCFRLANWNAEYLVHLVSIGTSVFVEE